MLALATQTIRQEKKPMIRRERLFFLLLAALIFATAHAAPSAQSSIPTLSAASTETPAESATPTAAMTPALPSVPSTTQPGDAVTPVASTSASSTPSTAGDGQHVDLDAIFPPGPGKDLVLTNCIVCHSIVRIVMGNKSIEHWEYIKGVHRTRVTQLSSQDLNTLFGYLEVNFDDTHLEPNLPEWFRQLW
jgi:hypothetical protein